MVGQQLDYEDALRALNDIAASQTHVIVSLTPRGGPQLALMQGRIERREMRPELRDRHTEDGGGDEFELYGIGSGSFVISRDLLESIEIVGEKVLAAFGEGIWRSMTLVVDGVDLKITATTHHHREG